MSKINIIKPVCTHGEMNKWYSQQHREEDGQPNRHHHNVARHVRIIANQQLRLHICYDKEMGEEWEVNRYNSVLKSSNSGKCLSLSDVCPRRLTEEGEVAKQCRNEVNHEAEANTDISNILHPGLSRSERHN